MKDPIKFGQFLFLQRNFKISSDNVKFFEFVKLPKRGVAVELGAGFGLGTVMLAHRYPHTTIYAVEYQKSLYELLLKNLELNKVSNVKPVFCDLREIKKCLPSQIADVVYCNPPFWRKEFLNPSTKKGKEYIYANFEVDTTYRDFVEAALWLLKSYKRFFLMMDTPRFLEIVDFLRSKKLYPKRVKFVFPAKGKKSHVFFVESFLGKPTKELEVLPPD